MKGKNIRLDCERKWMENGKDPNLFFRVLFIRRMINTALRALYKNLKNGNKS